MSTILKITSKENDKIKLLKKLNNKKYRDKLDSFFVENFNIIYDGLKAGAAFDFLFATQKFIDKNKKKFESMLAESKVQEYYIISEAVNKTFSNLETPEGICAVYKKPASASAGATADKSANFVGAMADKSAKATAGEEKKEIESKSTVVYLNKINNPGNLGAILRSALAFSLSDIIMDEHCADLYNHKTISAAKDSIFKLNIVFDKNLNKLKALKKIMPIISTRLKDADDISVLKKNKAFCLVLGNEANGVEQKIQDLSDSFVKIKMSDQIESLNVACAAAVIFYNLRV